MLTLEKPKVAPSKRQMIERLQFSNNLQIALRCCELIEGIIYEQDCKGMFLDAVCRNAYDEAIMRADDNNKAALMAKDFSVGRFMFTMPDSHGYLSGEKYYLKIRTLNGIVEATPTALCDGDQMVYLNFNKFLESWKII